MVDYDEFAAIAKELVEEHGRTITLLKRNTTPTTPGTPWTGNTATPGSGSGGASVSAIACFVPAAGSGFGSAARDRDLDIVKDVEQFALIASTSLPANTDLRAFDSIDDGTHIWKVVFVEELRPGPTSLIWQIGVKL